MESLIIALSALGLVGSLGFLAIYHRVATWWKTPYGRGLFTLVAMALVAFTSTVLFEFFGTDYPGYDLLRMLRLILGVSAIWYLLFVLVSEGARDRRRRSAGKLGADLVE